MARFLIGLVACLVMVVGNSVLAVDDDPIKAKLDIAKVAHATALEQHHEAVNAFFDKQEDTARKNGNKKLLDQIKLSRTAFQEKGTLPQTFPTDPRKKYAAARSALDLAYAAAIRDYTKARKDDEAAAVEKEFEQVKKSRKETTWVVLFNGKDTKGWQESVGSGATWKVQDGVIVGNGKLGYLITTRNDYENFHLRVEAMLVGKNVDSGICFRVQDLRCAIAYEANINNPGGAGHLAMFHPTGIVDFAPTTKFPPPGQFFTIDILVEGNKFTTWVGGQKSSEGEDKLNRLTRGAIALQQNTGTIYFRKVEIKELPAK